MSGKSDEKESPAKKPDGSAYKAHMEGIAERNAQARKAGKAERKQGEDAWLASRRADEVRHTADLLKRKGTRGKAESR